MKKTKLCGSLRHCAVLAAASGTVLAMGAAAMGAPQSFNWDPTLTATATGGGSGTTAGDQWDSGSVDWFNPTANADVVWNSASATTAVFGGTFSGTATVNIVSPTTPGANTLSAAGLTFNSTGYTLSSATANNTLYLTSPDGSSAPTISVGTGMTATIGAFVSGGAGPNNLTLGGTAGLNVSGGGTLVLGNAISLTGGITVNGSTLAEGLPALGAGNTTFSYLNSNNLTLNNGSFTVNSTNSPFSTAQLIGNVTMSGNSTITMSRGNSAASSSVLFNGSLIVQPNAVVNFSMGGNTSTNGALIQFGSTTLNGPATFVDYENATQNAGGATAGAPFGENGRLGFYSDNGFAATFLSGGSSGLAGTSVRINSAIGASTSATGNWTLGSSSATTPAGMALDLDTASGNTGGITSGTITVNPWSQLWLDGTGIISWGSSAQTITISGIGTVTAANAATAVYTNAATQPGGGALALTNPTTGQLGNSLASNVFMAAASSISVGTNTINEIDGNITGTGPLTIVGSGTLNLGGTANDWSGGTIINNGSIVVNSGSSLGSSAGQTGALTLASSGTTPTNTNLTLNVNQTVQTLSSSFAASTGTASNSIVLNGVNLNIVQKANGTFGPGASPTLSSFIADGTVGGGSISLGAASTGTLTLSGANSYTGGTTINGGALIVSNPAGSATGTGPVVVNGGTSLAGNGRIAGTVTLNGATLLPGANVGGAHLAGPLAFGGLTLNGGILDFNLNTPGSSDEIVLGNGGDLNLGAAGNPVTINLVNLGALDSGTYPLITYSSTGGSETGSFNNLLNGLTAGSKPNGFTFALHDDPGAVDLVVTAPASLTWSGGSGMWDTVSQNWNNNTQMFSNTGPSNNSVIFDDSTPGSAPFTVTVAAGGVTPGLVTFANNSRNYTVVSNNTGGAEISGNSTMVISGSGMVTLSGPNSFTGVVAVDGGGTLSIDSDGELGNATNSILLTSAAAGQLSTLQVTNNATTSRGISLFGVGGAIDVTGANTLTLNGGLAGSGGLTKVDTGTLILASTANSYTGSTTVSDGTLKLGAAGAMPAFSAITVASGAVLNAQTFSNSAGSISGPAGSTIMIGTGGVLNSGFDSTNTTYGGQITGTGSFGKAGSGTLTLTGSTNNFSGGFPIAGGGTIIGGTGGLGSGVITLSNGSTLQLTSSTFVFGGTGNPTLGVAVGGGKLVAPAGAAITLPTVVGANPLSISTASGGGAVINSTSTTAGGSANITLGSATDGGDVLEIGNTDANGNIGITSGSINVQPGGTFYENASLANPKFGVQIGFKLPASTAAANTLGIPASAPTANGGAGAASGNGTLTLNNNTTWKATGFTAYSGGSPTIATAANVTVNVPLSTDSLINNTALRAVTTGDTAAVINVTGNGMFQICSGAITTTMYAGSWNIGGPGSSPTFVIENVTGGTGETLNAIGYVGNIGSGWNGVTNPVTMNSGTILIGADEVNPGDSTPPPNLNSFRSPLTITGPSTIGSTGLEYSSVSTVASGAIFGTGLVTANISGSIDLSSTLTVDTFDATPINPTAGSRNLNFNTNGVGVTGNFTWEPNSSMVINDVNSSNVTVVGGQVSFGRTQGTVSVLGNATLQIDSGATVNIGFIPGVTAVSGIDPLTDNSGGPVRSVSVVDNGSIVWGGRTALSGDGGMGIKTYQVGGLAIGPGAAATLNQADSTTDRTVLVTPSITFSDATGKLDVKSNDLIVSSGAGGEAALVSVSNEVAQGRSSNGLWAGAGITSSAAAASPSKMALAVVVNDTNQSGSGSLAGPLTVSGSPFNHGLTTFDGQAVNDGDVLVKYTYYGDALLDGNVTAADYTQIDNGFNMHLTRWYNGDFNYDGVVNGDDYTLIDNAFNTQGSVSFAGISAAPPSPAEMIATNTSEIAGESSSAVPEPGSLTLLAIGAGGLLSRRRRR